MLRKRSLPQPAPREGRVEIAEFFGFEEKDVVPQIQPETFAIYIGTNKYAQDQYKTINKYGNVGIPGGYDFNKQILVRWNGTKVAPC